MNEKRERAFRAELLKQVAGIDSSAVFLDLYHEAMADFEADPWPAIQLAIAILLDKPILLVVLAGREPPKKLLGIADFVIHAASAEDIAPQLKAILDSDESPLKHDPEEPPLSHAP